LSEKLQFLYYIMCITFVTRHVAVIDGRKRKNFHHAEQKDSKRSIDHKHKPYDFGSLDLASQKWMTVMVFVRNFATLAETQKNIQIKI
jgi:hypothetical protein